MEITEGSLQPGSVEGAPGQALLDKLIRLQEVHHLTYTQMGALLGIDRMMWYNHRSGRAPLRLATLTGIARAFPALKEDVWRYLQTCDRPNRKRATN